MKVFIGVLVQYIEADSITKEFRILYIDYSFEDVVVINLLNKLALPEFIKYRDLYSDLSLGIARIADEDKYAPPSISEEILSQKKYKSLKDRRDKAVSIIKPLVTGENEIKILFDKSRSKLINAAAKEHKVSRQTIYSWLRKFWRGGMTYNTLVPSFQNCGGKGKVRQFTDKKPGPLSIITKENGIKTGVVMNTEWREKIVLGGRLFYENLQGATMRKAYRKTLETFCSKKDKLTGQTILPDPNKGEVFSYDQFVYTYKKEIFSNFRRVLIKKHGKRNFEVNLDARTGNFRNSILGPGRLYQIDATIADISLVSSLDSAKIMGRPTLFFVIDSFSKYIVGCAVTPESESWMGYRQALINVIEDKVKFCKEYNIDIKEDDWLNTSLPQQLLADRGAMEGKVADCLVNNFGVQLSNTAPYRPDWKAYIEKTFNLMNTKVIHNLPGAVPQNPYFGDKDYRLNSVLTLKEFTKTVIQMILNYNNHHRIENFKLDLEMIQDKVELYPRDIYMWGLENRAFPMRQHSSRDVEIGLLPIDNATVTEHGIKFRGLFYSCNFVKEEDWLLRAKTNGNWKINVSYHPRKTEPIYISTNKELHLECLLVDDSSAFALCNWKEVEAYFKIKKLGKKLSEGRILQTDYDLEKEINKIIQPAIKRKEELKNNISKQSDSSKLKNISKNKREEIEHQNNIQNPSTINLNLSNKLSQSSQNSDINHVNPNQPVDLQKLRKHILGEEN